jgi:hypothetical protein
MEIFCFLCCCGHHLGLVRRQEFSLPPTHEFNLAITRCAGDAPTNQVDAPKAPVISIRRIQLACRRISKGENYWLFCLVVFICQCVGLTPWVLPPTITSSRTSLTRCPSVASLYRVDAPPNASLLSMRRIHLPGWQAEPVRETKGPRGKDGGHKGKQAEGRETKGREGKQADGRETKVLRGKASGGEGNQEATRERWRPRGKASGGEGNQGATRERWRPQGKASGGESARESQRRGGKPRGRKRKMGQPYLDLHNDTKKPMLFAFREAATWQVDAPKA